MGAVREFAAGRGQPSGGPWVRFENCLSETLAQPWPGWGASQPGWRREGESRRELEGERSPGRYSQGPKWRPVYMPGYAV